MRKSLRRKRTKTSSFVAINNTSKTVRIIAKTAGFHRVDPLLTIQKGTMKKSKVKEQVTSETKIADAIASLARPIDELIEDADNVRMHEAKSIDAIEASLRRFGQVKPIVVDSRGVVIAGNGTLRAARNLGWTKLAVATFTGTKEEAKAYAIADNRTAELSHWDFEALQSQIQSLTDESLVESSGFSDREIQKMMADVQTQQVDVASHTREVSLEKGNTTCPKCGFEFDR